MFRFMTGDDLRRMRLSCNRTTEDMAKKISVSRTTYEKYEAGLEQPTPAHAFALNIYCRVNIIPLFTQLRELINHFNQYKDFKNDKANTYRMPAEKKHRETESDEAEHK
ncbi:helix-turn-helix transcriptional regulator [Thalassomonas actiniarum]|uniref:Helix-turn-helix transcriptional regulator n=1 Tax=Thalassomonas actiniarum TaxID=485447 RepID=A0AAF0C451_9GAMM|nr:helix-turn-helix transcriptional regulator [Thalassomonas actiniarum]WDD99429.1 helix-turn-helix transcriptional regulator [Thalassomonas actiniarum]